MSKRSVALFVVSVLAAFSLGTTLSASGATTPNTTTLVTQACKAWNASHFDQAHGYFRTLASLDSGFIDFARRSAAHYHPAAVDENNYALWEFCE